MDFGAAIQSFGYTNTVAVGTPVVFDMKGRPFPCSVLAKPGGGGTLLVEYSLTPTAVENPAAAVWRNWPGGAAAALTVDTLVAPLIALRFTAAVSTGTFELCA